ncbi:MAG: dapD [Rickettsiaceae bacterium]|jgi:2,3,4,5-tetrahydropyridine-2-carboxylate N-succinyltransferase|nr:dapD [Rickettsiaceae bacterium]
MKKFISQIEDIWQKRDVYMKGSEEFRSAKKTIKIIIDELDKGNIRVCEKVNGNWETHEWVKKAILLNFALFDNQIISGGAIDWFDKIPPKFGSDLEEENFNNAQIRCAPGSFVRKGAYIGKKVVLMPCFVNIGAYIDDNTMIDTWSTVGSCAQIGKNCHISGGVGIGGVLEPVQAKPVIIENNCFIGARSEVAEGVIVEEGAVISMGVYLGASTKIVDRETGEIFYGRVPARSVVVPGTMPATKPGAPSLYCAVIVKKVDSSTLSKTAINEILRGV